jgi:adenosylmethionine-8-amino-7-oxononanoate aminotransferase
MTTTEQSIPESVPEQSAAEVASATARPDFTDDSVLQQKAKDHLWMHFSRQSVMEDGGGVPIIVKGQGHHIWDNRGKKYFDGLSGLFVVNAGHGRKKLAEVAAKQAEELAFFPLWSYAHPAAIELADRLASNAPGDLNRVFFSTGGGEAVETAFKLAKYHWKLKGRPGKHKVISRSVAYHGTTQGALAITGIPAIKAMFEPVTPGGFRVPNTFYRAADVGAPADDLEAFGQWSANRIEEMILFEGPETVAAVFLEPVQNSGGCFPPPPGYFARVREICDQYDVLLVADEVITGFGRIGNMFASTTYGFEPDMITCAKGMTSGYSPIGATIVSEKIYEPFKHGNTAFYHGYTFGGHPVSSAVALANLDIFDDEKLNENVRTNSPLFRSTLEKLTDLPIVGDVRGDGYFFGIELVKDKATRETFNEEESERLLRGFLSKALFDAGLYCRADDRGDPVIQLAPPLTIGPSEFDEIESILRDVLSEAWTKL